MTKAVTFMGPLAFVAMLFAAEVPAASGQVMPMCASSEQTALVRSTLAGKEPAPLSATASALKMPEAVVASALPPAQAHGVSANHFQSIWKSIETWDDATTFIIKGPNLFEVQGPVGKGEPSTRSKFFNLSREGPGLAGHLRPDLYSSIYLLEIPGSSSTLRGIVFFDLSGVAVFSVYVPGEGAPAPQAVIDQFGATSRFVRSLPRLCPM
jgi:putative heme iron utilization protein